MDTPQRWSGASQTVCSGTGSAHGRPVSPVVGGAAVGKRAPSKTHRHFPSWGGGLPEPLSGLVSLESSGTWPRNRTLISPRVPYSRVTCVCSAAVTGRTHQACTLKVARASEDAVCLSSGLPSLPLSPGRPTSSGSGVQTAWERVSPLQTPATFTRCQLHIL